MKKILISSLGVGIKKDSGYAKANYKIGDKVYENEEFIANALCKHLNIDQLFVVGTQKSIWDSLYGHFGGDEDTQLEILGAMESGTLEQFLPKIEQQINKKLKTEGSRCFIIECGLNKEELWRNFDIYLEIAKDFSLEDEIFLDITHSFRSLSLMSFVMSEFVSNTKGIPLNIKGVYYGMLEYSRENGDITPIVDLSMFFELLNWSKAIKNLKLYGNSYELLKLIEKNSNEKELKNTFRNFSNALSTSDMSTMQQSIKIIKGKISLFKNNENKIYQIISDEISNFINKLSVESLSLFQYSLAKWYAKNKNYPLAYISLSESIVSAVCENEKLSLSDINDREKAKNILRDYRRERKSSPNQKLGKNYKKIRNIRNAIAHALSEESKGTKIQAKQVIENMDLYIKDVEDLFKNKK